MLQLRISRKEPHRIVDLLAYQHLVIQAHQEHQGDRWLGYDRCFCQRAAANLSRSWSTIDPTLSSLAFSGRTSSAICSHCFGTSHSSKDCELNSGSNPLNHSVTRPPFKMQSFSNQARRPLCFDWNESPAPGCPHPACRFDHICYYCACNTAIKDKSHKAIYCPHIAHAVPCNTSHGKFYFSDANLYVTRHGNRILSRGIVYMMRDLAMEACCTIHENNC